ncbi:MucR family transcriptional regulator [Sphingobium sp. TCM1]|uniref:MucR family transcriptional regulator n=1 Tax=Sphingobium sp. TCM1 TaxID=453246 RepID=UPI0009FC2B35|nr:MucR family transcriptional regulator [Sphingobium sp. TCM1]
MAFQFREFTVADTEQPDFTAMTVQLLSAYFANNQVPAGDIAGIIEATRDALERKATVETPAAPEYVPAVSIRKSLGSREHIISMLDGKPYKTLKRHLATNGLTPAEYRERYNLPKDYPMIAPAYSEHRRAVAAQIGLGRRVGAKSATEAAPVPEKKSRRVRARTAPVELGGEAGTAAPEPTPEPAAAPVQVEAATAKAKPVARKDAVKKSPAKKPSVKKATLKKAPAKTKSPPPAPVEEAPTAPAAAEAAKPVARKKAVAKAAAVEAAPSTKPKAPRRRVAVVKQDGAASKAPAPAPAPAE